MLCLPLQLWYLVTEAASDQRRKGSSDAIEEEIEFAVDWLEDIYAMPSYTIMLLGNRGC